MKFEFMKTVQRNIEDELADAKKYITMALELKDTDREFADSYYAMSQQEVNHLNNLHNLSVRRIENPPQDDLAENEIMKAVYGYLHERIAEDLTNVQAMFLTYKS